MCTPAIPSGLGGSIPQPPPRDAHPAPPPGRAGTSRTTFPSSSSWGCTCSLWLPAAPSSSLCSSWWSPVQPQVRTQHRHRGLPWEHAAKPRGRALSSAHPPSPLHSMPRGRAWTQAEVGSLLVLVGGSGEAALLMASTLQPNEALWREISQGLAAVGYGCSMAQCCSKWKVLKQAFHSERETRHQASCHSPCLPPHYCTMKSIWKVAGRPIFGEQRLPGGCQGRMGSTGAAQGPSLPGLSLFLFFQTW
nr:uncharacterized protein LOC125181256 [Anser cygnoides]